MNKVTVLIALTGLLNSMIASGAEEPTQGDTMNTDSGGWVVWHAGESAWLEPEAFWDAFIQQRGGLTWSRSDIYPPYSEVSEHDLFMVQLASGPCLMEFFHRRWRRAQDVQRWTPKFNAYGGCPDVFD